MDASYSRVSRQSSRVRRNQSEEKMIGILTSQPGPGTKKKKKRKKEVTGAARDGIAHTRHSRAGRPREEMEKSHERERERETRQMGGRRGEGTRLLAWYSGRAQTKQPNLGTRPAAFKFSLYLARLVTTSKPGLPGCARLPFPALCVSFIIDFKFLVSVSSVRLERDVCFPPASSPHCAISYR